VKCSKTPFWKAVEHWLTHSGGSHDRTDFLPLKAGFSIMALGAMAANPGLNVRLVPVGLSYFHPHKFRSRAVIEFGPPISVDPEFVEMYKEGGSKKRDACGKLLEKVHDGLKAVTLRAPDWETMMVCYWQNPAILTTRCADTTPGDPSRTSSIQDTRPASHSWPSSRALQAIHGRVSSLPT
jgi:hypothetical protein